jgi:hypothetical protein
VAVTQGCLYYADLYNFRLVADRRELFIRILQAVGSSSFVLAAVYFWYPDAMIGRGVFLIAALFALGFVASWRLVFEWLGEHMTPRAPAHRRHRRRSRGARPQLFERRNELGINIVLRRSRLDPRQ